MRNTAVIRLMGERLAWYSPGSSAEPQWLDDAGAADRLRSVISQRRQQVVFAVPGSDVRLLYLPVTAAEKKHLSKSLPYMLEEQVAADIDDLHCAYSPLGGDQVVAAVCSADVMERWRDRLAEFPGITRWIPEPLLLPVAAKEWCVVVEEQHAIVRLGQDVGFTIEKALLPLYLESALNQAAGSGVSGLDEPGADTSDTEVGAVGPAADDGGIVWPDTVVVYGSEQVSDCALIPQPVSDAVQWRQGNFYSALMLSDVPTQGMNLLQGNYAPRLPFGRWWRYWRTAAALFALAIGLQLAADYASLRHLDAQNLALRAAVESSYRQAYPQGAVVDAQKQLRRQLDALRGTSESGGFVSLMEQVGAVLAARPGTSIVTINYNDKADQMRLNLTAKDFETVEQLRSQMNAAGLEAVMESSNAQADGVRARLRVGARS